VLYSLWGSHILLGLKIAMKTCLAALNADPTSFLAHPAAEPKPALPANHAKPSAESNDSHTILTNYNQMTSILLQKKIHLAKTFLLFDALNLTQFIIIDLEHNYPRNDIRIQILKMK